MVGLGGMEVAEAMGSTSLGPRAIRQSPNPKSQDPLPTCFQVRLQVEWLPFSSIVNVRECVLGQRDLLELKVQQNDEATPAFTPASSHSLG